MLFRDALFFFVTVDLLSTLQAVKLRMLTSWCYERNIGLSHDFFALPHVSAKLMDFGASVGGRSHPCFRACNGSAMQCDFTMSISPYTSLSVHCGSCPWEPSHCSRPGCITAGGTSRPVHVANLMLPGPPIHVCHGDEVSVTVENMFENEGATIHWHGQWMRGTQYMDGVPYVTQCPVQPNNAFVYRFTANPAGTHMWHAHIGFMDSDGLFGPLVVRRPASEDPHSGLYDEDLPEHAVTIWHWYPHLTGDYLPARLDRNQSVSGAGLLVNGKGRIQPVRHPLGAGEDMDAPWEVLNVEQGKRYRFRFIYNSAVYCPVHVSIDNHTMLAIATDGADFSPVEVDSLMLNAGERWDVVISASSAVGAYWVRLQARGDCGASKSRVHQQAVLRYRGSAASQPDLPPPNYSSCRPQSGRILNPMQIVSANYSANQLVRVTDLVSIDDSQLHGDISAAPDHTLYISLDFKFYNELTSPGPYPQMNGLSFEYPDQPMVLRDGQFCTAEDAVRHCIGSYCSCPYTELIKLGALVEIVLTDLSTDRDQDHPYHLHGANFHVVAEGTIGAQVSEETVKAMNEGGNLAKKFSGAPLKDTVTVPSQGYAVIRFRATNPGYWIFHCHVSNHLHLGMAMVLRVGEHSDLPEAPRNFPRCGSFKYDPSSAWKLQGVPLQLLVVLQLLQLLAWVF